MDYHIIGFRECASEVARYMVTIEGMDIQDPLRLRLMSHLQCFVAQRELSAKSSATGVSSSNWSNTYQPTYPTQGYQSYPGTSPVTPHQQQHNQQQNAFNSSYMSASGSSSSTYLNSSITPQSPEYSSSGYGSTANNNSSVASAANTSSSNNASTTSPAPNQTATSEQQQQQAESQQPIYTDLSNTNDRLLNLGGNYHNYGHANQLYGSANNNGYNNNNNSKPYRPWHPEMAY
jgi:hairy and enhancer of split related with YRPW motif